MERRVTLVFDGEPHDLPAERAQLSLRFVEAIIPPYREPLETTRGGFPWLEHDKSFGCRPSVAAMRFCPLSAINGQHGRDRGAGPRRYDVISGSRPRVQD